MAIAIAHYSFGVAITLIIAMFLGYGHHKNVLHISLGVGVIAMLPDLWQLGYLSQSFHNSVWAHLFFAHRTLDILNPGDTVEFGVVSIAFLLVVVLANLVYQNKNYLASNPKSSSDRIHKQDSYKEPSD